MEKNYLIQKSNQNFTDRIVDPNGDVTVLTFLTCYDRDRQERKSEPELTDGPNGDTFVCLGAL